MKEKKLRVLVCIGCLLGVEKVGKHWAEEIVSRFDDENMRNASMMLARK